MAQKVAKKWILDDAVDGAKIKLLNAQAMRARNAANAADINVLKLNASDQLELMSELKLSPSIGVLALADISLTGSNRMVNFPGNDGKVSGLATPSSNQDAANKAYVDSQVAAIKPSLEFQDSVISQVTAPPGSPSTGDRYLVIATATGAFTGQENKIAQYNGSGWTFHVPTTGTFVSVDDVANALFYYGGSSWTQKSLGSTPKKERITLSPTDVSNGYVDLLYKALTDSVLAWVSGLMQDEGSGLDFTTSVVAGVTRITFEAGYTPVSGDVWTFAYSHF